MNNLEFIDSSMACIRCGAPVSVKGIEVIVCKNCGGLNFSFIKNESLFVYRDSVKELIHKFKFKSRWKLGFLFADFMISRKGAFIQGYDLLVPVPLNPLRFLKRGYNQSGIIGRRLSSLTGIPFYGNLLSRRGWSKPQSGLKTLKGRYGNMKDRIYVKRRFKGNVSGKRILLLDDVMTTGITASACSYALIECGADEVALLTVARTVKGK